MNITQSDRLYRNELTDLTQKEDYSYKADLKHTVLGLKGDKFTINGDLVYKEIEDCPHKGLMMNARFIQGIFDVQSDRSYFNRFGKKFDPEENTDALIESLPQWYEKGLRAITVGLQGGGPCFTTPNSTILNFPYYENKRQMVVDPAYLNRLSRILEATDRLGMVVIISAFYPGQLSHFKSGADIVGSLKAVCDFINSSGKANVILEVCNEFDLCKDHPLIGTEQGMSGLIAMAKHFLEGATPVGSSSLGGNVSEALAKASDVLILHGNGKSPQDYQYMIERAKKFSDGKPILCNEDSQCIMNMNVSMKLGVGWGYYNNMTKQEPPTDWRISQGEDTFFARRMAMNLGIEASCEAYEDKIEDSHFYLQGINEQKHKNQLYIRLASLYPETIEKVVFYRNGSYLYTAYNEPFAMYHQSNWLQGGTTSAKGDIFEARVHLVAGEVKSYQAQDQLD